MDFFETFLFETPNFGFRSKRLRFPRVDFRAWKSFEMRCRTNGTVLGDFKMW